MKKEEADRFRGFKCRLAYELHVAGSGLIKESETGWLYIDKGLLNEMAKRLWESYEMKWREK